MIIHRIYGDCEPLRPVMLNALLILVKQDDWNRSVIKDMKYLQAVERYCEMTSGDAVSSTSTDYETHDFLQNLKGPSVSTESCSKPDTFVGRLCGTLTEHVSQMKALFTESTPNDPTISSLSTTLPKESQLLFRNAVLEKLCEGFSLIGNLLVGYEPIFEESLITCDFAPLLKSTIVTCLDLLDLTKNGLNCVPPGQTDLLVQIIDSSWKSTTRCLMSRYSTLPRLVGNTFSDASELCSLLERTSRHSPPTCPAHLEMIAILRSKLPFLVPRTVEEKLVQRLIDTSKPVEVSTAHGLFHTTLINAVEQLVGRLRRTKQHREEWKRVRQLQFERVLKPAQAYLRFVLQREEFVPNDGSNDTDLPTQITNLLMHTILLERDLVEFGEIVETGREEWEVVWLVETNSQKSLAQRLKSIGEDDERMKRDEKQRWKKRVVRRREVGHEDAMEGWLMKTDRGNRTMIVKYLENEGEESGMNTQHGKDGGR
ncbi:hypothetical protein BLNAU_6090 [Blattamonas nauphoetae]|uniref:Uncharacterized protein n=1 Tax=Blattamonas nauphoetae TaxID=2049346 RepID=A0ABQ9Y529_9EUKA|nr:hypothetical protein BLNAU_6090 [Blattamonas nauphoetae]